MDPLSTYEVLGFVLGVVEILLYLLIEMSGGNAKVHVDRRGAVCAGVRGGRTDGRVLAARAFAFASGCCGLLD